MSWKRTLWVEFYHWYLDYSRTHARLKPLDLARAAFQAGRQYEKGD